MYFLPGAWFWKKKGANLSRNISNIYLYANIVNWSLISCCIQKDCKFFTSSDYPSLTFAHKVNKHDRMALFFVRQKNKLTKIYIFSCITQFIDL